MGIRAVAPGAVEAQTAEEMAAEAKVAALAAAKVAAAMVAAPAAVMAATSVEAYSPALPLLDFPSTPTGHLRSHRPQADGLMRRSLHRRTTA